MYKEVALMIDYSDKPMGNLIAMLGFAQSIAYNFAYLGQNLVRLAAVGYSDTPTIKFNLDWAFTWYDWTYNPLNSVPYAGGGSNLSAALDLVRTSVFSVAITRPGVPKVAILITDNLPTPADSGTLLTALANMKAANIQLVVVGIISNSHTAQTVIAFWNNTDERFVSFVRDYNQLGSVLPAVMQFSCANPSASNG